MDVAGSNSLSRVLNLKASWLSLASCRGAASYSLESVNLLKAASRAGLSRKLEPCNSRFALLALEGVFWCRYASVLGGRDFTQLPLWRGVHVEEGGSRIGEEVVTADCEVGWGKPVDGFAFREIKLKGNVGGHLEEVRISCRYARGIEESGNRAAGYWDGSRVTEIAGVVLGASTNGHMLEVEAR